MSEEGLIVIVLALLGYCLVSGRLAGSSITSPMIFSALGFGLWAWDLVEVDIQAEDIHILAEVTLILVLFADAARIDLRLLRRDHDLPARTLAIGLPVGILTGTLVGVGLFPQQSVWQAALLAAMLVPTDAALGQSVVSSEQVPVRLRQALNVESGLNDGVALPFILMFASIASEMASGSGHWIEFGLLQLTLGPLTGVIVGYAGSRVLRGASRRGWLAEGIEGTAVLAVAALAFLAAEPLGGNGLIATFVAGMVFGNLERERCGALVRFVENEGRLLVLATFLLFGVLMLPDLGEIRSPRIWVYAVLSLTVVRLLPIALSLIGSGLRPSSVLFLGWFGPRGLASILYLLLIVEAYEEAVTRDTYLTVVATVALSIVVHGITAAPAARRIGRRAEGWRSRDPSCEELKPVCEIPTRIKGGA